MCNISVAISIDRDYDNYAAFEKALNAIESAKFISYPHELMTKYANNNKCDVEYVEIKWNLITNPEKAKENRFGKLYNPEAPAESAQKIVSLCSHVIKFGIGDYNINLHSKDLEEIIPQFKKRYQF